MMGLDVIALALALFALVVAWRAAADARRANVRALRATRRPSAPWTDDPEAWAEKPDPRPWANAQPPAPPVVCGVRWIDSATGKFRRCVLIEGHPGEIHCHLGGQCVQEAHQQWAASNA